MSELATISLPTIGVTSAQVHSAIDALEQAMLEHGNILELPVIHTFTHGMYARELFMPKGALVTSKIHLTQHQYVVLQGKAEVFVDGKGWVLVQAGDSGITEPGTRRVLRILEDSRWKTFHPNPDNLLCVDEIEKRIIFKHDEHLKGIEPRVQGSLT